jgi:hypothetical protein
MLSIYAILAIWILLSLPVSLVLGFSLRDDSRPELVGMDGEVAVFRRTSGLFERVSLTDRASH